MNTPRFDRYAPVIVMKPTGQRAECEEDRFYGEYYKAEEVDAWVSEQKRSTHYESIIADLETQVDEYEEQVDDLKQERMKLRSRHNMMNRAIRLHVASIEHWLDTGVPSGPEESRMIYETLKNLVEDEDHD